jgi:threonine/homoserine/homoserine lactone efflux protein
MDYIAFIATIILVSLSGVLMPGPVFATAIAEGRKSKHAGFLIATGHAVVEVPIIITLFIFGKIEMSDAIRATIGIAGGVFLLYFAFSALKEKEGKQLKGFIAGFALSTLNPYFIMWWLTVGFTLAINAAFFGVVGLISLIVFHEMCDFVWYEIVSFSSNKGMKFRKVEKGLIAVSFILMLFFGLYFIYDGIKIIMS